MAAEEQEVIVLSGDEAEEGSPLRPRPPTQAQGRKEARKERIRLLPLLREVKKEIKQEPEEEAGGEDNDPLRLIDSSPHQRLAPTHPPPHRRFLWMPRDRLWATSTPARPPATGKQLRKYWIVCVLLLQTKYGLLACLYVCMCASVLSPSCAFFAP